LRILGGGGNGAWIEGVKTSAMIDTGAGRTVLDKAVVDIATDCGPMR
jgi:predicted aspartyl protease